MAACKILLAALCVLAVSTLSKAHPQGFGQPIGAAQQFAQPGFNAGQQFGQSAQTGVRETAQTTRFQEGVSGSAGQGTGFNSGLGFNG